jgi:hypothetical protein
MSKLKTMRALEDELGEVLHSSVGGESLHYGAHWEEIVRQAAREAKRQQLSFSNDVRTPFNVQKSLSTIKSIR